MERESELQLIGNASFIFAIITMFFIVFLWNVSTQCRLFEFWKEKKSGCGKCLCFSINIRSRNTNPIHPPWLCLFWASVTCHALLFCLYFMMHMTLLKFYGTVN